jgi:hypothetical protein
MIIKISSIPMIQMGHKRSHHELKPPFRRFLATIKPIERECMTQTIKRYYSGLINKKLWL